MTGFRASMRRRVLAAARTEGGLSSNGWLTTFNDLMTLLMVFFVLLFSMSSIDVDRLKHFQSELQAGLGIMRPGRQVDIAVVDTNTPNRLADDQPAHHPAAEASTASAVVGDIEKDIQALVAENKIQAEFSRAGVSITLENELLFPPGSAAVQTKAHPMLDQIGDILQRVENRVRIEGHTDDLPIHSERFPSNWELSTARAVNVLKYFVEIRYMEPARFSAVGYGASRPLYANDSPTHRAKNRRVEIVLVTDSGGKHVQ